jgi:BirA family transcriptional regulator, biotin operon repressor / biotin---[acetyl-CoA-carboxylase] ligase
VSVRQGGHSTAERLFAALADGAIHSGTALAARLGCSRNAVWKAIDKLRDMDVPLEVLPRRGYRLPQATEPLRAASIRARLTPAARARLRQLTVSWSIDSTNSALLLRRAAASGQAEVLLAEHQSAGRGRRARRWLAAPGSSLCFSVGWQFAVMPADFGALSLAVGVALRRAVRAACGVELQLKWPNDLLFRQRKLAGVLIELRAEGAGAAYVVVGVGLNLALGADLRRNLAGAGAVATDLVETGALAAHRNELAAVLVSALIDCLADFGERGFAPLRAEWQSADALRDSEVVVSSAAGDLHGRAAGVDPDGALRLMTDAGIVRVLSGDVSLRREGGSRA